MRKRSICFSVAALALNCLLLFGSMLAQQTREGAASQGSLPTPPRVNFVDIAARTGLSAKTVDGNEKRKKYIIETTGSGVAFFDYDNDGWPDVFLVNGSTLAGFPKGQEPTSHLYHNNRDGTFTDVTKKAGVALTGWGQGVCAGDYDNDGWEDLFVTFWGHNVLLHNNGDWPDIFVACDSTPSLLFHNNHDGTFAEIAVKAGVAYNEDGREEAGMGADAMDYDGDGWLDIIRTNFSDETSTLYHNNGDGTFTDVTSVSGLGTNTQFLGWGTLFVDVDNDGWPDLFMANGHVYPEVDSNGLSSTFRERKVLYWNQHNGKFKDISLDAGPGITAPFNSHGVAAADFDNDGALEILVNNSHDVPSLLKNHGEHGNWISLKLVGTKSNRDAIGALVTVNSGGHQQVQEVRSGGSYISQRDFRLHFGLGKSTEAESVEVRWPSGVRQVLHDVDANKFYQIQEGSGQMTLQRFARKISKGEPLP